MVKLVTLEEASSWVRRDMDDGDDLGVELLVEAASGAVLDYLKTVDYVVDGAVTGPVPPIVKAATLQMFSYLYRLRGEDEKREYEQGYLPRPVTALLYPLRHPSLA